MSVATYDFSVNPAFSATVMYAGVDREPILIVDDLLRDPDAIVRFAETGAAFRKEEKDFYPGIRKPLSMDYTADIGRRLQALFRDTFGAGADAVVEPVSALLSRSPACIIFARKRTAARRFTGTAVPLTKAWTRAASPNTRHGSRRK
jgi:hypothetical protein